MQWCNGINRADSFFLFWLSFSSLMHAFARQNYIYRRSIQTAPQRFSPQQTHCRQTSRACPQGWTTAATKPHPPDVSGFYIRVPCGPSSASLSVIYSGYWPCYGLLCCKNAACRSVNLFHAVCSSYSFCTGQTVRQVHCFLIQNTYFKLLSIILYEVDKMNVIIWILIIFGGLTGVLATFYLFFSIPVIVIWKIYRKCKYHTALYDWSKNGVPQMRYAILFLIFDYSLTDSGFSTADTAARCIGIRQLRLLPNSTINVSSLISMTVP